MSIAIESLFTRALGLQVPWSIKEAALNTAHRRIDFTLTCDAKQLACPLCQAFDQGIHDRLHREWHHLDFFQFEAWLHAEVPRIACNACGKTTQIEVSWAREGNVNPIGWRACYDEGKRCAETLFFDYHRQFGVEIKVARIFNTYGSNMHPRDGRVASNFIMQPLTSQPLMVHGDGNQTRSLCYVDDLVDGLIRLMASELGFTGPVNLGNLEEVSMIELAQKIIDFTGSRSTIKQEALPPDGPRQRQSVIDLAQKKLQWKPSTSIDVGLKRTISYFEEVLQQGWMV